MSSGRNAIAGCALLLFAGCAAVPVKVHEKRADDPQARRQWEWEMLRSPLTGKIPRGIRRLEREFARRLPRADQSQQDAGTSLQWTSRGPTNISGRTRAMAVDVSDPTGNTLLAGGVSGGIWRTSNGGQSWTKQFGMSQLLSVTCIAQDRRSGKQHIWYAGTGEYEGNSADGGGGGYYHGDGIYKSVDGGLTWALLPATVSGTPQFGEGDFDYVWNIATDPSRGGEDVVYAAVYGAIMRSADGGSTWTRVLGDTLNGGTYTDVVVAPSGKVHATISGNSTATEGYYTSDTGLENGWSNQTPAGFPSTFNRIVIGIPPNYEWFVYLLAHTPGAGSNDHSLWFFNGMAPCTPPPVCPNAPVSWINRSANLPQDTGTTQVFDSQWNYDMVIAVKPDDRHTVFIGGTSLYRSTDGFATTTKTKHIGGYWPAQYDYRDYAGHFPDQHAIAFSPADSRVMFTGVDGGVFRTDDNTAADVTWTSLNNNYVTTQYYSVAIDPATAGNDVIIGGMQDRGNFFAGPTTGGRWIELTGADGAVAAIANGRTFYCVEIQYGELFRYNVSDSGVATYETQIDPAAASGKSFVNPYILDPNDSKIMYYVGRDSIWRHNNVPAATRTSGWTRLETSYVVNSRITALAAAKSTANRLYYGTWSGKVMRIDGAHSGASPTATDISTGKGLPLHGYVSGIAVDPTNADSALVVFSNYEIVSIYHTANGGATWTAVAGSLEENLDGTGNGPSVRTAAILPQAGKPTLYLVGTSTGVYSTTLLNGTSTVWAQEAAGVIGNAVVTQLVTRPVDGRVVAATHGYGVFSATPPSSVLPPSGVTATAATATSVNVSWNPSSGATGYRVYRTANALDYTLVGSPSSASFTDTTATSNTAYLYKVRAYDGVAESIDGMADLATTILFTDPTLVARTTTIKAVHVSELRIAIGAVRTLARLPPAGLTDASLGSAPVRRQHAVELRSALDAARRELGLPALTYTDAGIIAGSTTVRTAHVADLRSGVR